MKAKNGAEIDTFFPMRAGCSSRVPNWVIYYNGTSMEVDEQRIPPRLARMLPKPLCTAGPDDFLPFCILATAYGLMKPIGKPATAY